ncbi:hypothetical protein KIW84_035446 [Lathyrus oleraceus]|uniref:DUF7745 domain-containing protein n=1 Tax=Pisum sativum TaxID=3888 RepID=A0A9D5B2E2_PEA|nr:hypothetical protein KIW84_035446 [Pisum sativum]
MLNSIQQKITLKYGGILDLLRVPVKIEAITALAQFYDPPLRKVTRAWEKAHIKDNKAKRKDTSSRESYTPWIKEMVRLVKLLFIVDPTYVPYMPDPITVSTEEVDRLKAIIARLEQDKESLEHSICDATYEKN